MENYIFWLKILVYMDLINLILFYSQDFEDIKLSWLSSKFLSENGVLAAHDIHHNEYPGVNKAWNEFKIKNKFHFKEFTCKKYFFVCGMGLATKKL